MVHVLWDLLSRRVTSHSGRVEDITMNLRRHISCNYCENNEQLNCDFAFVCKTWIVKKRIIDMFLLATYKKEVHTKYRSDLAWDHSIPGLITSVYFLISRIQSNVIMRVRTRLFGLSTKDYPDSPKQSGR